VVIVSSLDLFELTLFFGSDATTIFEKLASEMHFFGPDTHKTKFAYFKFNILNVFYLGK
jgi:hypothetical protein